MNLEEPRYNNGARKGEIDGCRASFPTGAASLNAMNNQNSVSVPKLSLFSFVMIVVGLVIGLGIFRTAATSADLAITPSVYFTAWVLGGFIALCGALTYAEIGSRISETGGYYKVFSLAYHPSIAFGINCIILISNAASLSAVALVGAGYFTRLFPDMLFTDVHKAIIGVVAILTFYAINLLGLRVSSGTQNVLMVLKIAMVMVLIGGLFFAGSYAAPPLAQVGPVPVTGWLESLGLALVPVSFTYGGYQQTINFGKEVSNPVRNLPRGIFTGIIIIISLYLLVNLSYYYVVGFDQMKGDREVAFTLIEKIAGTGAANLFSFLLFFGVLAYVNALLLSNPRVMYAMSTERVLPTIFGTINRRGVLTVSLTVFTAVCLIVLFFSQQFESIMSFSIFLDCFGMIASTGALFILRPKTKHKEAEGIYKMKRLYPWLTILFITAYLFIGGSIAIAHPEYALTGTGTLAVFVLIYFIARAFRKKVLSH